MRKKVIIVGAGPGGLAAAMLLAKAGVDVVVFEKKDQVGGRTSSIRHEGYTFDLGPTFFLYPQVLEHIYTQCGLEMHSEIEMIRLDPHYRLYFEGRGTLEMRSDITHQEQEIAKFCEADGRRFRDFMNDNRRKLQVFKPVLESPISSPFALMNPALIPCLKYLRLNKSVESDLRRFFSDQDIRLACAFQSKYLGMSPFTCPSLFTILSFLEYEYGIWHPLGGCAAVSRNMAKQAESFGAEIRLEEPVCKLKLNGRRVEGVITDRGEYRCDALVINEDFATAMTELVPNSLRRRWSNEQLKRKKYSCSTFMLYLGLDGTYPEIRHHNIFLSSNYQQNLKDIEPNHVLSENPSFYLHNPSLHDPSMAPAGKTVLYLLLPITHEHPNVDWDHHTQRYRDLALAQLAKVGLENIEPKIEFEKIITPRDWNRDHSVYNGAVFNLTHNYGQMLYRRPHNRFEELDSVYLVGGGTHPGSGLPVIYQSALISTNLLKKDLGV